MATVTPACRYAELVAALSLARTGRLPILPNPSCGYAPFFRVRIESRSPGLASWHVAEVCVWHADDARMLPGFLGNPWPIPHLRERELEPVST
jgi:hypothetical protein